MTWTQALYGCTHALYWYCHLAFAAALTVSLFWMFLGCDWFSVAFLGAFLGVHGAVSGCVALLCSLLLRRPWLWVHAMTALLLGLLAFYAQPPLRSAGIELFHAARAEELNCLIADLSSCEQVWEKDASGSCFPSSNDERVSFVRLSPDSSGEGSASVRDARDTLNRNDAAEQGSQQLRDRLRRLRFLAVARIDSYMILTQDGFRSHRYGFVFSPDGAPPPQRNGTFAQVLPRVYLKKLAPNWYYFAN